MKSITSFGAVLVLLGILGLAIPVFTTSQPRRGSNLGDLKIQNTEHLRTSSPSFERWSAPAGVVLIGAGLYQRSAVRIIEADNFMPCDTRLLTLKEVLQLATEQLSTSERCLVGCPGTA